MRDRTKIERTVSAPEVGTDGVVDPVVLARSSALEITLVPLNWISPIVALCCRFAAVLLGAKPLRPKANPPVMEAVLKAAGVCNAKTPVMEFALWALPEEAVESNSVIVPPSAIPPVVLPERLFSEMTKVAAPEVLLRVSLPRPSEPTE